jgi:hypothetical protein
VERPVRGNAQVTLDGAGNGAVSFGPGRHGVSWSIQRISVQTSTTTLVPEARVYRDSVGEATFISGTFVGSFDTDDAIGQDLENGERLIVAWTGGDPGAMATATFYGTETTPTGGQP